MPSLCTCWQAALDWRTFRALLIYNEHRLAALSDEALLQSLRKASTRQPDQWAHLLAQPEKGCLLVARDTDAASDAEQSVVLLCNHGEPHQPSRSLAVSPLQPALLRQLNGPPASFAPTCNKQADRAVGGCTPPSSASQQMFAMQHQPACKRAAPCHSLAPPCPGHLLLLAAHTCMCCGWEQRRRGAQAPATGSTSTAPGAGGAPRASTCATGWLVCAAVIACQVHAPWASQLLPPVLLAVFRCMELHACAEGEEGRLVHCS